MAELLRYDLEWHSGARTSYRVGVAMVAHRVACERARVFTERRDRRAVHVARGVAIGNRLEEVVVGAFADHQPLDVAPRPIGDAHDAVARMRLRALGANLFVRLVDVSQTELERDGDFDATTGEERRELAIPCGVP